MTDDVADAFSRAAYLAEWTRLPTARFEQCYKDVRLSSALAWEVIVAKAPDEPQLEASREAARHKFLGELARVVGNREDLAGRPVEEIQAMLGRVRGYGLLQAMTNQQKGFLTREIFKPLEKVCDASAVVFDRTNLDRLGTAFLVAPDLVMTAAHVVMEPDGTGQGWTRQLKHSLAFRFKSRDSQPDHEFVEILPDSDMPLVCSGDPHGIPPNRMERLLDPPAGQRLDYALVRLAQRVNHVEAVEIDESSRVEQGKVCWAFGYPEGDALMLDVDIVTEINMHAARWLHQANTAAGFSGGCCANHKGRVVGLHEGTLELPNGNGIIRRNRCISMAAIREAQRRNGQDPLKGGTTSDGLEMRSENAVAELYQAGKALAGSERGGRWRELVLAALGVDLETQLALPSFHPWFKQRDVEEWIDNSDPEMRLCLIHGDAGVGKSFCTRILREKLGPRGIDLFAFNPTQLGAMSWRDAISPIMVPEVSDHRTDAASIRYRDFQQVIEEVRRRESGGRPSYVVMDFGPSGDAYRFDGTQWPDLIAALLAAEGVRLMVIGLEDLERAMLIDRLFARPETEPFAQAVAQLQLQHLRQDAFRTYIKALAKARGRPEPVNLNDIVQGVFAPGLRLGNLLTVMAALAAIKYEAAAR
jgi:hypothetical protein